MSGREKAQALREGERKGQEGSVRVGMFFAAEKRNLALVTVTGIVYNVGMAAGPWFEGQMVQGLYDLLAGRQPYGHLLRLCILYVAVISLVQLSRAGKRLYVRRFANNTARRLKGRIYHHLLQEDVSQAVHEGSGAVMTRAVSDADACAEGMRKVTTEIFDTGLVMIVYLTMLFSYDWRLTLLVLPFPPLAYLVAQRVKVQVTRSAAEAKESMERLDDATIDRASNALTYRIYGEEAVQERHYEERLSDYERRNILAGIWQSCPAPVYLAISMIGAVMILYFGGRNVLGLGWRSWSLAAFSTYLACFAKMATKSSHAANLFNAVQKAQVSWGRIREELEVREDDPLPEPAGALPLVLSGAGCEREGKRILSGINLTVLPGQIVGVTGPVASGKSSLGQMLLPGIGYTGQIRYGERELSSLRGQMVCAFMGHDPMLLTGTVCENVTFHSFEELEEGDRDSGRARLLEVLSEAQLEGELTPQTPIGAGGQELSGGQQSRLALARALYSRAPVLVLDDPFGSVDRQTEERIFAALRRRESDRIILILSHRLEVFPQTDQVLYLEQGRGEAGTHEELLRGSAGYAALWKTMEGGERA